MINIRSTLLKLLLIMAVLSMPLQVYAEGPKIEKAWLGVYRYNGTYYDPLGNTFDGDNSYNGPIIYTVINYELSNGEIIRQIIKVNNREMTLEPVNTRVVSWTDENGTIHQINRNPLPYETEIPVGSQIDIRADYYEYNDDEYGTGKWIINISENGINFDAIEKSTGYSNTYFVLQNLNRSSTWDIPVSSKDMDRIRYSAIIPFNGSNATIYDIRDYNSLAGTGWNYSCAPPENFFKTSQSAPPTNSSSNSGGSTSIRVPIPMGAVIISIAVMLFISYKRID